MGITKRDKLVGKIYFDDNMGITQIVWTKELGKLRCFPTCHLDLSFDLINIIEDKFDGDKLYKEYGKIKL